MVQFFDENAIMRISDATRWVEANRMRLASTPTQRRRNRGGGRGTTGTIAIASVDSDATGGGYYNCHKQTLDATDWDTDTNPFDDTGDSIVVLNLAEAGSSVHNLDAGDLIMYWSLTDDESNTRNVGVEVFGRHTFGEW
jgi:hypothetical protein